MNPSQHNLLQMLVWGAAYVSVLILAGCLAGPAAAEPQPRPNIIYFNADDLGVMDVGFNSPRYRTPHIDKLREQGMLFTDAYAPAANCAPSRAACMSGQYAPRHGVYTVGYSERGKAKHRKLIPVENKVHLDPDIMTIAGALKAGGYRTIHLGKWHLGPDPTRQGFDVNIGGGTPGGPSGGGYFAPFNSGPMAPFSDQYPKGTHRVDIFADQAIRFMQENWERPFFVHMAFYSVHSRLEAVPEFIDNYRDKDVHAVYASMIEKMDQGIGKILAELESLGLAGNTLVVFTSDNGGICQISPQTPFRAGKGSYFEGGIREPLVMRWGKWKLHEYFEDGRIELYDLAADSGERANLAATHPEKAAALHAVLKQWREDTNAPVPTERNPAYAP